MATAKRTAAARGAARQIPTLGEQVYRSVLVPEDRRGQYIGAGTEANVQQGLFNHKAQVAITPEWANILNQLRSQGQENGSPVAFEADSDARITVDPNSGLTYVPGSAAQIASGSPLGLAFVRNPAVTYGAGAGLRHDRRGAFIRVGGPEYRRVIKSVLNGATALPIEQIQKLIVQGFRYGLAPVFQQIGITPQNFENFDDTAVRAYYDDNLKNPDQQAVGKFASASAFRNHSGAGHIIDKRTGQPVNPADLVTDFESSGSVAGKYGWSQGLKSSKQRAGLTSHPLRSMTGVAVQGPVTDPNAGDCNIYGSGPGMGGNGHDQFQLRMYKAKREHRTKSAKRAVGSRAGTDRSIGAPTWYCAGNKAEVTDPGRAVYGPGTARGGDVGLGPALNEIAADINNPNVSANALSATYTTWSTDPNRAPPQFQVPSNIPGRQGKGGFALFQAPRGVVGPDGRYQRAPVSKAQGRQISEQFEAQKSNQYLPQQYKGSARGTVAPNPFLAQ